MTVAASREMNAYFEQLQNEANRCYDIAREARQKGLDPELDVEIPQAEDLASRVEMLLEFEGIADIIRETSRKHPNREEMSIVVAKRVAREYRGPKHEALDKAVRVGLAVLTEGILVAPLDGIAEVKIHGEGGSTYASISFAGPIRSAGGTGQAMSVLIADVVRTELGIGPYDAVPDEIERWKEEVPLYRRLVNLQYLPSEEEIEAIIGGCKVCVDGEGTEDAEISGFRDLPRIGTNRVRGGACLVVAEGLALKAKKLRKHVKNLKIRGWDFLGAMIKDDNKDGGRITGVEANFKFIKDMVAGRPVYSHPSSKGGFRLRYGRSRTAGLASISIHPAVMYIVQETLAIGTQIKIERPGKAGITTPCDRLEGPLVLMRNGNLVRVKTMEQARKIKPEQIDRIVDMGEILIPVGEFLENNHPLVPAVFDIGWYSAILSSRNIEAVDPENMSLEESLKLAVEHDIPLHPAHTFMWNNLTVDRVREFREMLASGGKIVGDMVTMPDTGELRHALMELGIPYIIENDMLNLENGLALYPSLGLEPERTAEPPTGDFQDALSYVSELAGFRIMDRRGTFIGTRMARPEKAAVRKMKPPVHGLFPVGTAGGSQRLFTKAAEGTGKYKIDLELRKCRECGNTGFLPECRECGGHTWSLGRVEEQTVDAYRVVREARERLKLHNLPKVKGVQGMISRNKTPEMPEKAILRAKHEVFVFKDGTCRFDCTDAPLTHFRPREVDTSVEKLRELGYTADMDGNPLENENQILELRSQDIVLADNGGDYLLKVSQFIDELLVKLYGMEPFYNAKKRQDLVGSGLLGLSPHTSGGVLSRLIGFTRARVGYAHPFFHAAKRRNCFAPDTRIWVVSDTEWESVRIKELVDNVLKSGNKKKDDFGTVYCNTDGLYAPSISRSGQQSMKRITAVSKHPAPEHMIEFKTRSGRNITVTPEHKMLVMNSDLEFQPAHSLKVGDMVPSPKKLDTGNHSEVLENKTPGTQRMKGDVWLDKIIEKNIIKNTDEHVYSLTVEENHTLVANDLYTGQCDGDEDCFMLLMDGLLNFSFSYLPEKRGGRMDAPLVLMTKIDPNEIDKEAHAIDVGFDYDLAVYEGGMNYADPKDLEAGKLIDTVGTRIGSNLQYENFGFTLDTGDISAGPVISSYKTLESMGEKTRVQLELARMISAVDERDVAERLLKNHLIPDMIGNLRTFSSQKIRCTKCGKKYRRMPLAGACKCGNKLNLTVHVASVRKYLEMSKDIARKYQVSDYVSQRIEMLEESMNSMFENDKVRDCKLTDFFG